MVTRIKEVSEDAKVAIRNVRRDGNKTADQEQKDKTLSEDDRDSVKSDIQELTKKYEAIVSEAAKAREKDVMDD
jgi:ribosome recycling factor